MKTYTTRNFQCIGRGGTVAGPDFSFSLKFKEIRLYYEFPFEYGTKWNSVWSMWKLSVKSYSFQFKKETKIKFSECAFVVYKMLH